VRSFKREEVTSYESGFKAELAQFHAAVTGGESPPTDGADGARDIAVCQAIIQSVTKRGPVELPSEY
jgi:predicted dehydrogenase